MVLWPEITIPCITACMLLLQSLVTLIVDNFVVVLPCDRGGYEVPVVNMVGPTSIMWP